MLNAETRRILSDVEASVAAALGKVNAVYVLHNQTLDAAEHIGMEDAARAMQQDVRQIAIIRLALRAALQAINRVMGYINSTAEKG